MGEGVGVKRITEKVPMERARRKVQLVRRMMDMHDRESRRKAEGRLMTEEERGEFAALVEDIRAFQCGRMTAAERVVDDALAARLQAGVAAFENAAKEARAHGEDAVKRFTERVLDDLLRDANIPEEHVERLRKEPPKH